MLFPLERLIQGRGMPACIGIESSVRDALTIMIENDFSQLPVVDQDHHLSGMISEQSIARTYYHEKGKVHLLDLQVVNCQTRAVEMRLQDDVFNALDRLKEVYAIVIVENKEPVGILTDYDTTHFFRDLSEDLLRVQDVETTMRERIQDAFPEQARLDQALIRAFGEDQARPGVPAKQFDDLTFGDYMRFMRTRENWPHFEAALGPMELFLELMGGVRIARNKLAHFRGELTSVERDSLLRGLDWMEARSSFANAPPSKEVHPDPQQLKDIAAASKGKYDRLRIWLASLSGRGPTIAVTFPELERVLGDSLPPSSRQHRSWWANDSTSHAQSIAWLGAGWRVQHVDFAEERVVFHRKAARESAA